ncbi:hypothetical protein MPER_08021, partial [Moniliophthora perniciosa FA553]
VTVAGAQGPKFNIDEQLQEKYEESFENPLRQWRKFKPVARNDLESYEPQDDDPTPTTSVDQVSSQQPATVDNPQSSDQANANATEQQTIPQASETVPPGPKDSQPPCDVESNIRSVASRDAPCQNDDSNVVGPQTPPSAHELVSFEDPSAHSGYQSNDGEQAPSPGSEKPVSVCDSEASSLQNDGNQNGEQVTAMPLVGDNDQQPVGENNNSLPSVANEQTPSTSVQGDVDVDGNVNNRPGCAANHASGKNVAALLWRHVPANERYQITMKESVYKEHLAPDPNASEAASEKSWILHWD